MIRQVLAFKDNFIRFYESQDIKTQLKIEYTLDLIRYEESIPEKFFKKLTGTNGIYEIRIIAVFKNIRILCFFDAGKIIVLTNCFVKKKQKIPKNEIIIAEKLKEEYLAQKNRI
jgi:phage-related protein